MRAFVFASAISLVLAGTAQAAPRRVASLNLCTDELLLMLGEPAQIVSVTHLAQQPAETMLWREARRYRRNDGSLVSVAGLRPDLVLTMGGGARDRARIAGRLGIRVLDLPYPQSLADIEQSVRTVAAALGRRAGGSAAADPDRPAEADPAGAPGRHDLARRRRPDRRRGEPRGAMDGAWPAFASARSSATGCRSSNCWSARRR